jgi:hypothetical protein
MAESRCTNNGSRTRSSAKWTKNVLARFAGLVILLTTAEINMEWEPKIGDLVWTYGRLAMVTETDPDNVYNNTYGYWVNIEFIGSDDISRGAWKLLNIELYNGDKHGKNTGDW